MKEKRKLKYDDYIFYSITIAIIIIGIIAVTTYKNIKIPECYIYKHTGFYCPGCGCTRAFMALINGNLKESIILNPTVMYAVVATGIYMTSQVISRMTKNKIKRIEYKNAFLYIGIAIFVINCIIRNALLHFFNIGI